jgi:hypothetical protein
MMSRTQEQNSQIGFTISLTVSFRRGTPYLGTLHFAFFLHAGHAGHRVIFRRGLPPALE